MPWADVFAYADGSLATAFTARKAGGAVAVEAGGGIELRCSPAGGNVSATLFARPRIALAAGQRLRARMRLEVLDAPTRDFTPPTANWSACFGDGTGDATYPVDPAGWPAAAGDQELNTGLAGWQLNGWYWNHDSGADGFVRLNRQPGPVTLASDSGAGWLPTEGAAYDVEVEVDPGAGTVSIRRTVVSTGAVVSHSWAGVAVAAGRFAVRARHMDLRVTGLTLSVWTPDADAALPGWDGDAGDVFAAGPPPTGALSVPAGSRLDVGANPGTFPSGLPGLLGRVVLWPRVLSPAHREILCRAEVDPRSVYGVGGRDSAGSTNRGPAGAPARVEAVAGSAAEVDLARHARDPEGRALAATVATAPAKGAATVASGKLRLTPAAGSSGADRAEVQVRDPAGRTALVRVDARIKPS